MPPAPPLPAPVSLEQFLESMQPWVRKIVGNKASNGMQPLLFSYDDLAQNAHVALLKFWEERERAVARGAAPLALEHLQKLGNKALKRDLMNAWNDTLTLSRGGPGFNKGKWDRCKVHANCEVGSRFRRHHDDDPKCRCRACKPEHRPVVVADPNWRRARRVDLTLEDGTALEIRDTSVLDPLEVLLLEEETDKVEQAIARAVLECESEGVPLRTLRRVLSGLDRRSRAFHVLKLKVLAHLGEAGYSTQTAVPNTEEGNMETSTMPMAPETGQEPTAAPEPAESKSVAKRKRAQRAPKAEPTEPGEAPAAPAEKKARKPRKAAKKAQAEKAKPISAAESKKACAAFKKGDEVTYLGGSRADWLKKGTGLVIKATIVNRGRSYLHLFAPHAKKSVVLAARYVEAK